jgi:hypothetical protein
MFSVFFFQREFTSEPKLLKVNRKKIPVETISQMREGDEREQWRG